MKIAIQLYGHLRTYKKCIQGLKKNILDHYNCDVFIHTWSKTEHTSRSWYEDNVRGEANHLDQNLLQEINYLYSPKKIKVEKQNLFDEIGHYGTHDKVKISLKGMKYMTYSQYAVNELRKNYEKKNNIEYDYVVVIRPDVMPYVKLDFDKYSKEFDFYNNVSIHFLHTSEIWVKSNKVFNYPLAADVYYFAKPESINKITSIYKDFDYFYKNILKILPTQVENPEISFFENIIQKGVLPRQYVNYFAIKRNNEKNDVKLLPPNKDNEKKSSSVKGAKFVKYFLKILSKYAPDFLNQGLIKLFDLMGACGRFLQNLEEKK